MLSEACPAHLGETFFHAYDYNGNTLTKVTVTCPLAPRTESYDTRTA